MLHIHSYAVPGDRPVIVPTKVLVPPPTSLESNENVPTPVMRISIERLYV